MNRDVAQAYYEAYKNQYREMYADLPAGERPDPPKAWVRGELSQSGYTKNYSSNTLPRDPASLYANYRLRADMKAIPESFKNQKIVASIDLETAGPSGAAGFKPENGRIIEIGVVNYDQTGKEISRYSQLIKPEDTFLDIHGTGAEEIHKISVNDLQNSPSWEAVQKEVKKQLEGKTILAQNAAFEYDWLSHHLPGFQDSKPAVVDTLDMSRKHLDLPNHQLATICGFVGVQYTEGHRALHDADVAGKAFFALNKHIQKAWKSKPARRKAAQLADIPIQSRWDSWSK